MQLVSIAVRLRERTGGDVELAHGAVGVLDAPRAVVHVERGQLGNGEGRLDGVGGIGPPLGGGAGNIDGLLGVMRDLLADGNSVVMVDHDTRILAAADYLVEMGPEAGAGGGHVVACGTPGELRADDRSLIGRYLPTEDETSAPDPMSNVRPRCPEGQLFEHGAIHLETSPLHTVHALSVDLPVNRLTAVTGVSGSGKTTLVLEELIPALNSVNAGENLPASVRGIDPAGIVRAQLIDATPIGANVRSTVATYCGVLDDLRRAFARTDEAKAAGLKAGAFSYNTGKLRCPTCDGTGQVSLDVQFLPDVDVPCPDCRGRRYGAEADAITWNGHTLAQLMAMSIDEALYACASLKKAHAMLQTLHDLGLGYLTLGEATPALSGGEAQRLKLASEMGKAQDGALFVFDEPTIGLHPRDVRTLLNVFQHLVEQGATVAAIEHDLDFKQPPKPRQARAAPPKTQCSRP